MRNITTEDIIDCFKAAINCLEQKIDKEKLEKIKDEEDQKLYEQEPFLYETKRLFKIFRAANPTFENLTEGLDKNDLLVVEMKKVIEQDIKDFMDNKITSYQKYDKNHNEDLYSQLKKEASKQLEGAPLYADDDGLTQALSLKAGQKIIEDKNNGEKNGK